MNRKFSGEISRLLLTMGAALCLPLSAFAAGDIVARVNAGVVSSADLNEEVDRLIPQVSFHGRLSGEKREEFQAKALETLIRRELIHQDAVAKKLALDDLKVQEELARIRDRFPSRKEYKNALSTAGLSEEGLRTRVERQMLIDLATRKKMDEQAKVSDEEIRGYYESNASKFSEPETVNLRIITLSDQQKAQDVLRRIKSGENFGDIAARISEDNYRIKGGELGYVHRGRLLPAVEDAAFTLEPGTVSGLLQAQNKWFIVNVIDKKPARRITLEEAMPKLRKELAAKNLPRSWRRGSGRFVRMPRLKYSCQHQRTAVRWKNNAIDPISALMRPPLPSILLTRVFPATIYSHDLKEE